MCAGLSGSQRSRHLSASPEGYVECQMVFGAQIWVSWLKKMMRGGRAGTREVLPWKAAGGVSNLTTPAEKKGLTFGTADNIGEGCAIRRS
jgi:hypothetical protein